MTTVSPIEPTEITAGRLHLRPWQLGDVDDVAAACTDPEIARWTGVPQPYTAEIAHDWVERVAPAEWAEGKGTPFAVVDAVDGRLLGSCSLMGIGQGGAEVGYWCVPAERGQGVLTAAVGAVCRWGFEALELERITWLAFVGNEPSRRVAEKAGFVVEGTLRRYLPQRGVRRDAWIAGLLATDPVR